MITTILLDYGNVLAYPKSGHWFLPPDTKKIVGLGTYVKFAANYGKLEAAFKTAKKYLDDNHMLRTEEEELAQFTEFYRLFANEMGAKVTPEICEKLAHDAVFNDSAKVFYPDVLSGITALKAKYKVGVLSDTWPSLRRLLTNAGIAPHLDTLVMSCDHGITKESPRLFEIAVEAVGKNPENILFVDDTESNLQNAKAVGLKPVLMDRDGKCTTSDFPIIRTLGEISAIAEKS